MDIDILRDKDSLTKLLLSEKSFSKDRDFKYFRDYMYPHEYEMIVLKSFDRSGEAMIPLLYRYIYEMVSGFVNGKEVLSGAVGAEDMEELLGEVMNVQKINISEEVDCSLLCKVLDKFDISCSDIECVQFSDDDFYGLWWYGIMETGYFLCRYIHYM